MAALSTVSDYVASARGLLSDTVQPYRYSDADLIEGINLGILEARRVRADLFLDASFALPSFSTNDSTAVAIDEQYRVALLYYIIGHAQLRDDEENQDSRAAAFLSKFTSQMLAIQS